MPFIPTIDHSVVFRNALYIAVQCIIVHRGRAWFPKKPVLNVFNERHIHDVQPHTPYVSIVSHIPCVSVIVNRLGPAAETLAPISSHMASRQPSVVALCSNYYFHHVWLWLVFGWFKSSLISEKYAFHLEIRAKTSCQTKTFELQIPFRSPLVVHRLGTSWTWLLVWLMLGSEPGIMIYHCIYIQVSRFHQNRETNRGQIVTPCLSPASPNGIISINSSNMCQI